MGKVEKRHDPCCVVAVVATVALVETKKGTRGRTISHHKRRAHLQKWMAHVLVNTRIDCIADCSSGPLGRHSPDFRAAGRLSCEPPAVLTGHARPGSMSVADNEPHRDTKSRRLRYGCPLSSIGSTPKSGERQHKDQPESPKSAETSRGLTVSRSPGLHAGRTLRTPSPLNRIIVDRVRNLERGIYILP